MAQAAARKNPEWRRRYVRTPGDASAQEHCQSSDGAQAGDSVVLDVAEWL
jgi:hypothetical protein